MKRINDSYHLNSVHTPIGDGGIDGERRAVILQRELNIQHIRKTEMFGRKIKRYDMHNYSN